METNLTNSDDKLIHLRERVHVLDEDLAKGCRALELELFAREPLPFSEQELKEMVEQEKGLELDQFIGQLENPT